MPGTGAGASRNARANGRLRPRPTLLAQIEADGTTGGQHRRGCNCKKSHCQKKYCECFQVGCRCARCGCCQTALARAAWRMLLASTTDGTLFPLAPAAGWCALRRALQVRGVPQHNRQLPAPTATSWEGGCVARISTLGVGRAVLDPTPTRLLQPHTVCCLWAQASARGARRPPSSSSLRRHPSLLQRHQPPRRCCQSLPQLRQCCLCRPAQC